MSEIKSGYLCNEFKIPRNESNNLNFLAVGCWGVFCEEGERTIVKAKKGKPKKVETVIRGQQTVKDIIYKIVEQEKDVEDLFLAGDNIYVNSIDDEPEYKDEYKKEQFIQNYNKEPDIEKQLTKGFFECFMNPRIKNYFVIAGNHDVKNCKILEQEIEYGSWTFPSLFYSVLYNLKNYDVHVMFIDTNIIEYIMNQKEETLCNFGNVEKLYQSQIDCIEKNVKTLRDKVWKIMVGHIPYRAVGHKTDKCIVDNSKFMKQLFEAYQPHIYICADEHNQQFLTENIQCKDVNINVGFVVAGSGGTQLDDTKVCNEDNNLYIEQEDLKIHVPYSYTGFGIPLFKVSENEISIDYYIKENDNIRSNFNVKMLKNRNIITEDLNQYKVL